MTWSKDVVEWQRATFGETNPHAAFDRAAEEWIELESLQCISGLPAPALTVADEAADVCIVLAAFVASLGLDLSECIEAKMQKNKARKWVLTGQGCGRHVEDDD